MYGLEQQTERFSLRFDVPAQCAELLHANDVDLGLIPSIEYPGHDYRIVPGVSIASDGPVASVAIFSKVPTEEHSLHRARHELENVDGAAARAVRDAGSRSSLVWCSMPPDLGRMIDECDAALVIGDNALFLDHDALGLEKVDLGEEWIGMTGLPFVYAFWAGRPGVVGPADSRGPAGGARDRGLGATATIGRQAFPDNPEKAARADLYLRENVKYALGEPEIAGLRRFYELAAEVGALPAAEAPRFY